MKPIWKKHKLLQKRSNTEYEAEINLLKQVLSHPAGFNIDIFDIIRIRGTEQGIFEVTCEVSGRDIYKAFSDIDEAVRFFVELRHKYELGIDIEEMLFVDELLFPKEQIPRLIEGYWVAPWHDIPEQQPEYSPNYAVLPRIEIPSNSDKLKCLDFVILSDEWYPVSDAGALTYAHSKGLLMNEPWEFVHFDSTGKRSIYNAFVIYEKLTPDEITKLYGQIAGEKCRDNRLYIELELIRTA